MAHVEPDFVPNARVRWTRLCFGLCASGSRFDAIMTRFGARCDFVHAFEEFNVLPCHRDTLCQDPYCEYLHSSTNVIGNHLRSQMNQIFKIFQAKDDKATASTRSSPSNAESEPESSGVEDAKTFSKLPRNFSHNSSRYTPCSSPLGCRSIGLATQVKPSPTLRTHVCPSLSRTHFRPSLSQQTRSCAPIWPSGVRFAYQGRLHPRNYSFRARSQFHTYKD